MTEVIDIFLIGIVGTGFIAFLYPYLIYPQLLKIFPRKGVMEQMFGEEAELRAVIILAAYNEEKVLQKKLNNLKQICALNPNVQVYAHSDGSTDKTESMLHQENDWLNVTSTVTQSGKMASIRSMIERCTGDIIVLTDANTMTEPTHFSKLLRYFANPNVGIATGKLIYINDKFQESGATANVGGAYWRLEERIKYLESACGNMMGADGALLALRRECFPEKVYLNCSDDLLTSLSVILKGYRCISAQDVHSYERGSADSSEEFTRKRRVACRAYTTHRYFKAEIKKLGFLDRWKWFSHRVIRWWGGSILATSLVASQILAIRYGIGLPFFMFFLITAFFIIFLGVSKVPVAAQIYEILRAILATTIGVFESIFKKEYVTWTPTSDR